MLSLALFIIKLNKEVIGVTLVENELKKLDELIIDNLEDNGQISNDLVEFLTAKSKKIRSKIVFLFAKMLDIPIDEKIYNLACAVEFIHNSTIIHDDIIDNAQTRRAKVSLNYKLGNNLSVLAGDLLLAQALKILSSLNCSEVIQEFSNSLYLMCRGEINQNFSTNKIPTLEEYIKKSEYKTAELFKASLLSFGLISEYNKKNNIISFTRNFGIAFQIKDDLVNILQTDLSKPTMSDIINGIYTAPLIFLNQEIKNVEELSKERIIELIQSDSIYVEKTKELIKLYANKAIDSISYITDNDYKKEIINLTQQLYEELISEY